MSKRKLLLADDSVTIQKVVNLTFADEGIEVIAVGDGDSAMLKVAEISPDLIMADVNMPGLSGYEICERIRQDETLCQTPVILLVGSFEPFDEEEARRVGADDYLTKPFQSIRQLVNKVTILLESHNPENGLGSSYKEASSLEDTLEMSVDEIPKPKENIQYGDTGFDDEMIQTNQVANYAFDETQKFESRNTRELYAQAPVEILESNSESIYEDILDETVSFPSKEIETIEVSESFSKDYEVVKVSEELEKSEMISEELLESPGFSYETKESESLSSEVERNGYGSHEYEIVSENSELTELNNYVSVEIEETKEIISDEIEETKELEETDEIVETQTEEIISDEIVETQEVVSNETISNQLDFVDTDSVEDISSEIESNELVSEEIESDEPVSEEIESNELVSEEIEIESYEPISEEINENDSYQLIDSAATSNEIKEDEIKTENEVEIASENTEFELVRPAQEDEIPFPEFASVLETDEDDILQLPPIEIELEDDTADEVESNLKTQKHFAQTDDFDAFKEGGIEVDTSQISPELIDAIVAKVLERLSEKAIKEVAWEVVPQMTELIVTKMAEEKLK